MSDLRHVADIRSLVLDAARLHVAMLWLDCRNRPEAVYAAVGAADFSSPYSFIWLYTS
jgi:hypothetical protein